MNTDNIKNRVKNFIFNNNDGEDPCSRNDTSGTSQWASSPRTPSRRPNKLFSSQNHLNCENNNLEDFDNWQSQISSEEDNSPTQMNNCRKFIDKAPLVKRLSINLLRSTEEYRPLLCNSLLLQKTKASIAKNYLSTSSSFIPLASTNDGYTDEQQFHDADEMISSKFGDSCRKSLTSMLDNRRKDYHEIDYKRNFGLRETSSANSSPKMFVNAKQKRIRGLSIIEQHELRDEPWFQNGVPREISLEVLQRKNPGDFLVRESTTKPGCFALSLRAPPPAPKVVHYLILRTPRGYKIKGCKKEFTTLRALITHHSVMQEQLPVPLALERPKHILARRRNIDDFDICESVNDFQKMEL